jgi:Reverse transcriptase (RNA-dependent DNA polymerase)
VLVKLNSNRLGCTVKGLTVNTFMYADDLIILSASVTDLQRLINMCVDSLTIIQLSVNAKKCFCMRIGKRYSSVDCNNVIIDNYPIQWSSEIRYLGVYFISGHVIKFNLDYCKNKI